MITVSNIVNASREELLCITYEMLLENIKAAEESSQEEREKYLKKSIDIIQMLVGDLNFEFDLSKELFRIYIYVQGLLVSVKSSEAITEAYKLIGKVYEGFKNAKVEEQSVSKSIDNAQVIYAGLTYGPNDLNELSITQSNRGFKA